MFKIIKKTAVLWHHEYNTQILHLSDFEVVSDNTAQTFFLRSLNGSYYPRQAVTITDIVLIDETDANVEETFATVFELEQRLVELQYTPYRTTGSGASTFTELNDTPNSYTGQAGKVVTVNDDEDALEFTDPSTGGVGTLQQVTENGNETDRGIILVDEFGYKVRLDGGEEQMILWAVSDVSQYPIAIISKQSILFQNGLRSLFLKMSTTGSGDYIFPATTSEEEVASREWVNLQEFLTSEGNLQQVTDNGATTTNPVSFASTEKEILISGDEIYLSKNGGVDGVSVRLSEGSGQFIMNVPFENSTFASRAWVNLQGFITNVITALGYTPENVANKANNLTSPDNTKYPTTLAVSDALVGKITLNNWVDISLTSTITGWASFTTREIEYLIIGNEMSVRGQIAGVSNSSNTRFTIPFNYTGATAFGSLSIGIVNNGTAQTTAGLARILSNTNEILFFTNGQLGNFAATNNKTVTFYLTFKIN